MEPGRQRKQILWEIEAPTRILNPNFVSHAFGRVPRVGARETDGMSVDYYEKVGRDADEARRAFELWTRSANADFRSERGASYEQIRTSVVSTALAR